MSVAALMAPIAVRQHGLCSLAQLDLLGVTPKARRRAVESGEIERLLPSVYSVAGAPRTWRRDLMAAVLDAGAGSAASHRSAVLLLGVARRGAPEIVEITVPRTRSVRAPWAIVHRSLDLSDEQILEIDGVPCTGPLRTLVDLGAVEPKHVVADCLERALHQGQVTLRGAEWMLADLSARGRNGCGAFRAALDERAVLAATPHEGLLEPRMASVARRFGLPVPVYQHRVFEAGVFVGQPDFSYPEIREAFEVDGFEVHGTPRAMTSDFEREHRLRAAGWGVTRFTWFHVVKRPVYVADVMRSVLGAKGALVGR